MLDEDEDQHNHFEFPIDDDLGNIMFSRLLFKAMVWWAQPSNNGNANQNMPTFYDLFKCPMHPPLGASVHVPIVNTCPCN
jgi:hypothetical protein